eukprot:UN05076
MHKWVVMDPLFYEKTLRKQFRDHFTKKSLTKGKFLLVNSCI